MRRPWKFADPDVGRVLPIAFAVFCFSVLVVSIMLTVWFATRIDWSEVLDFIAPTAEQTRRIGWAAISEAH